MQINFGIYKDKYRRHKRTILEGMYKILDFPKNEKC